MYQVLFNTSVDLLHESPMTFSSVTLSRVSDDRTYRIYPRISRKIYDKILT